MNDESRTGLEEANLMQCFECAKVNDSVAVVAGIAAAARHHSAAGVS